MMKHLLLSQNECYSCSCRRHLFRITADHGNNPEITYLVKSSKQWRLVQRKTGLHINSIYNKIPSVKNLFLSNWASVQWRLLWRFRLVGCDAACLWNYLSFSLKCNLNLAYAQIPAWTHHLFVKSGNVPGIIHIVQSNTPLHVQCSEVSDYFCLFLVLKLLEKCLFYFIFFNGRE